MKREHEEPPIIEENIKQLIGEGSYCKCSIVIHPILKQKILLKHFSKSNLEKIEFKNHFSSEINSLNKIDFPLIVKLFGVKELEKSIVLFMEYLPHGTFLDYVNKRHCKLHESEVRKYMYQILLIFNYLQNEKHIIHRDLKFENILLDVNNNLRLIDFGFAAEYSDGEFYNLKCGSTPYLSPEIVLGKNYNYKTDNWSIGVIFYALLFRRLPFSGSIPKMLHDIVHLEPNYELSDNISPAAIALTRGFLQKDPQKRLSIFDALNNEWFLGVTLPSLSRAISASHTFHHDIIDKLLQQGYKISGNDDKRKTNTIIPNTILYNILKREKITQILAHPRLNTISHYSKPKKNLMTSSCTLSPCMTSYRRNLGNENFNYNIQYSPLPIKKTPTFLRKNQENELNYHVEDLSEF